MEVRCGISFTRVVVCCGSGGTRRSRHGVTIHVLSRVSVEVRGQKMLLGAEHADAVARAGLRNDVETGMVGFGGDDDIGESEMEHLILFCERCNTPSYPGGIHRRFESTLRQPFLQWGAASSALADWMRSARDGHASLTYLVAAHFGKLFPLKLHPNVLVLAGVVLALVAHMVMAVTCPYMRYTDRSVRPSRWVTLMAGVLLWLGRVRLDGSIWCAMLFAVEGMQSCTQWR